MYITRGKKLQYKFVKYVEESSQLLFYKLGDQHIPSNVVFPAAKSVALINCSRLGVFNLLTPYIFPEVREIQYMSAHPGAVDIHRRFDPDVKWVVPDKKYPFFETLCRAGVGQRSPQLLSEFVTNKRIVDGASGFDVSFHFDLRIPEMGVVDGEWYRDQMFEYIANKQAELQREADEEMV
jgi:hypothetical protein